MKKLTFTILAAMTAMSFWAQQPLCPVKEGVTLLYEMKNAKGKVQTYARQVVTSVDGSGNNLTLIISSEVLDAKKKPAKAPIVSYTYKVENGAVVVDPTAMMNSISAGLPVEGSAEGTPLVLPANMKANDALPDCEMKMQVAFMKISASYTDGVCEGDEDITTPAGTFNCKKVKFNCKSTAMGIKSDLILHSWYAPGIGIVKQDAYNKGKLSTTQELVAVSN